MAVQVHVTSVIQRVVGGQRTLSADGGTVIEMIDDIEARYPGFRDTLVGEDGKLYRFVNIYLNNEDVRFMDGAETSSPRATRSRSCPPWPGARGTRTCCSR